MSPTKTAQKRPTSTAAKSKASGADPGRLVGVDWLADHLDDADLRVVHVAPDRRVYNKRHIPCATYSDLHKEIALKGKAPETGDAERE
jgi:3-mercaptopyruvate sulfurtransferase SseA